MKRRGFFALLGSLLAAPAALAGITAKKTKPEGTPFVAIGTSKTSLWHELFPKDDITAKEIAEIMAAQNFLMPSIKYELLSDSTKRHFQPRDISEPATPSVEVVNRGSQASPTNAVRSLPAPSL
jgi:hypothetical protein